MPVSCPANVPLPTPHPPHMSEGTCLLVGWGLIAVISHANSCADARPAGSKVRQPLANGVAALIQCHIAAKQRVVHLVRAGVVVADASQVALDLCLWGSCSCVRMRGAVTAGAKEKGDWNYRAG